MKPIIIVTLSIVLLIGNSSMADIDVYIDPGHGDWDPGSATYISEYNEDDINLQVSLLLEQYTQWPPIPWLHIPLTYAMSRNTNVYVSRLVRCMEANNLNALSFVSVHHNSAPGGPGCSVQNRAETYYSTTMDECVPVHNTVPINCTAPKDTMNTLAAKIGYRLRDTFGKSYAVPPNPQNKYAAVTVLTRTQMASVISEASFICINAEADSFYNDINYHRVKEARALWEGIVSYLDNQGFGIVEYQFLLEEYQSLDTPSVFVDTSTYQDRSYTVPYESCWLVDEQIRLEAVDFWRGIGQDPVQWNFYTFHHWEKIWYETGWTTATHDSSVWLFQVPIDMDSAHYYRAYFTGGDYDIEYDVNASTVRDVFFTDNIDVSFQVDVGVDTTTAVEISLKRDGVWFDVGTWFAYDLPNGTYSWTVTDTAAQNCQFRMIASDKVDNIDTAFSDLFIIYDSAGDYDSDFIPNLVDNCPFDYNYLQLDYDSDGVGDSCDLCRFAYNPGQEDTDGDWVGDVCDNCPDLFNIHQRDYDSDGVGDWCDNCSVDQNPSQENADGDLYGDICDNCTDTDGDSLGNPGFPYNTCPEDNCPSVANADQLDELPHN